MRSSLAVYLVYLPLVLVCLIAVRLDRPRKLDRLQARNVTGGSVTCLYTACIESVGWGVGMMSYTYYQYNMASAEITPYDTANTGTTAPNGSVTKYINCAVGNPHCGIAALHTPATGVSSCSGQVTVTRYKCQ